MYKLIALGNRPVRELKRSRPTHHVLPPRQIFAEVLKLLLVQSGPDSDYARPKRHAPDAGYLQRPLLLRAQMLNLGFDHLAQILRNLQIDFFERHVESPTSVLV